MVRRGTKTVTWRLYDDKDITVNDKVELIDKVVASDPATWIHFAVARIDTVIEKRLGEITGADLNGHESFASREEMLKMYQTYYGPQVSYETPVKMIHFSLLKELQNEKLTGDPSIKEAKLYTDGGSRGNPGPSASGFVIMDMDDRVVVKKGVYLGVTTNNQAEYQALKLGLEEAKRMHIRQLHVFMDSMLVINQMKGIFKVKNRDLWPIHEAIKELNTTFEHIFFTHVPREMNKIADKAVNDALNEAEATQ